MNIFSFATRTLFNQLLNGNRGSEAPFPGAAEAQSVEADAMLRSGGPRVLSVAPAAALDIVVTPQAADHVHAVNRLRMLPAWSPESTSGGWVANPHCVEPTPLLPAIIIPQAQWATAVGELRVQGLSDRLASSPMPTTAYPGLFEASTEVHSTGAF